MKKRTINSIFFLGLVLLLITLSGCSEKREFDLKDHCGPFMGTVLHTINDESQCGAKCKAKCAGIDYDYVEHTFDNRGVSCNSCECICKG
ncbi:MAG: hypothetical protein GY861_06990 [bacterium]|nr:hypothetical protein [bacterium]